MSGRRQPQERRDEDTDRRTQDRPDPPAALPQGRMGPEDLLRLQASAGNMAVVRSLASGGTLMRDPGPAPVAERKELKAAARRVARLSGEGVDKTLEQLAWYVDSGFSEDGIARAASAIAGLANKSGAALYAALRKMPAVDAEAYWIVAGLIDAKHPDLTTAIRLVRDYRERVWFDIAEVVSRDAGAGKLFFESLTASEVDEVWPQVEKERKLTLDARTAMAEVIAAVHAKATKADIEATAKMLSQGTGIAVKELREKLEIAVGVGVKSADLRRLAPEVLRLGKMKFGPQIFEALMPRSYSDVEAMTILASDIGPKYERLKTACDLVLWFKTGTWVMFAQVYAQDTQAGELLLDTVDPAQLDEAWKQLERTGLAKPDEDRLRGRVESAQHRAAQGDSVRASFERSRGKEIGQRFEKRVDTVLEQAKFARKGMLANIDDGVKQVDSTLASLIELAGVYKKARDKVDEVIKRAEAQAKLDQEKMDALLGIAIGVGVGMGLGVAVPLAHGASRAATAAIDAVGEVYEQKVGDIVKGSGSGVTASPSGDYQRADPLLKQTEAYKMCGELYRELATLGPKIDSVTAVGDVGARLKADARELAVSGTHHEFVIPQLERKVLALERSTSGLKAAEHDVFDLVSTLRAGAEQAKRQVKQADQRRMEKQIWIHWLGSRTGDEAELAGKPPVKQVLRAFDIVAEDGEDSSIGWGVGSYHSDANSRTGAKKAAEYSKALSLAGREGKVTEGQARELETRTPDPSAGNVFYAGKRTGLVGKASVAGATEEYGVMVLGPAKPGDEIVITGVVGREDRDLYPGGDDKAKLGIVLSARPKPRNAGEAIQAIGDDARPKSAI